MSEALTITEGPASIAVVLKPNRSITAEGLKGFFAIMAGFSLAVAGTSFYHGNVFAPLFAVAELGVLALCLKVVWRSLDRGERITLGPDAVEVERIPGGLVARFNPHWVQVVSRPQQENMGRDAVFLTSHGRSVEVGSFLSEPQRAALAQHLRELVASQRDRITPSHLHR